MPFVRASLLLAFVIVGCGGSAPPPKQPVENTPAPVAKSPCETAADHVAELIRASEGRGDSTGEDRENGERMMRRNHDIALGDCESEHWTEEQIACVTAGKRFAGLARECHLTAAAAPAELPGGSTGIPECDLYLAAAERFAKCEKLPREAADAQMQALEAARASWASLSDPNVPVEARKAAGDACRQAADALNQAWTAAGCQ